MADFKRLRLDQILVGQRLRDIDDDHALVIGMSMQEHGQQTPITVRSTNAAERAYTLVAGGHRYRGAELIGQDEIDVLVVKADGVAAQLLEIAENLHRNELSVLDRAVFAQKYRELFEQEHGEIRRGGDRKSKDHVDPLVTGESFAQHVADRLGISQASAKRLDQIARNLHSSLRSAIRGTSIADNQSALLKLSKLEPVKQRQAAVALKGEPDLKRALALLDDAPVAIKEDPQTAILSTLISAWSRASDQTKEKFSRHQKGETQTDLEDFT